MNDLSGVDANIDANVDANIDYEEIGENQLRAWKHSVQQSEFGSFDKYACIHTIRTYLLNIHDAHSSFTKSVIALEFFDKLCGEREYIAFIHSHDKFKRTMIRKLEEFMVASSVDIGKAIVDRQNNA